MNRNSYQSNNYTNAPREKLPTNRSFGVLFVRGLCSFAILVIFDTLQMQKDLNTIIKPYTPKRAGFLFFTRKSAKIMNEELERRGINYRLNTWMLSCTKMTTALNLLSEDYNLHG